MGHRSWRLWVSFLVAVGLLGGFVWILGPRAVGRALRGTDLSVFAVGLGAALVSLLAWSETQRHLLVASGATLSPWRGFVVYAVGMFMKQVLPMGHAAGPALAAYAVGTEVDRPYGENLGPASIAEFLILVASVCLAVVGLGYRVGTARRPVAVRTLAVGLAVTLAALAALALVVWYRRRTVEWCLFGVAWCLRVTVGRLSVRVRDRTTPAVVSAGVDRYYATLTAIAADRRRTAVAFGWALLGWVAFSLPLVTSARALGVEVPVAVALFLAPAVGIVGLVPLPGGLGGSEIALTGLLVAVTGVPAPLAAGVTLLYRLCTYWFVVLVCGLAAVYRSARPGEARRRIGRRS